LAVALAEHGGELERSYRNTVYCASTVLQSAYSEKLRSEYCGNRWCLICNRVRIARSINKYEPRLIEWPDRWFLTLTVPNCSGADLRLTLHAMQIACRRINQSVRQTDKIVFRALRKLEVTYNGTRDDYHPHYHFVFDSREAAGLWLARWMRHWPDASMKGQDLRRAGDGSLVELFKYFTKLTTPGGNGTKRYVPVAALDVIFLSMRRKRVYQPLGFAGVAAVPDEDAEIGAEGDTEAIHAVGHDAVWRWDQAVTDWVDQLTGELLTDYTPTVGLQRLVDGIGQ
jgi:hypothetical protein